MLPRLRDKHVRVAVWDPEGRSSRLCDRVMALFTSRFRWGADHPPAGEYLLYVVSGRESNLSAAMVVSTGVRSVHIEYVASRKPGMGRRLVGALCGAAGAQRWTVTAEVRHDNPEAQTFFRSMGFVINRCTSYQDADKATWAWCTFCA